MPEIVRSTRTPMEYISTDDPEEQRLNRMVSTDDAHNEQNYPARTLCTDGPEERRVCGRRQNRHVYLQYQ